MNRYNNGSGYVGKGNTNSGNNIADTVISYMSDDNQNYQTIEQYEGAKETADPIKRSYGLVIRFVPFTFIWLTLSVGIALIAELNSATVFLIFSVLTAITYLYLDRQEKQFSTNGLERLKILKIAEIRKEELRHTSYLKRIALDGVLQLMERDRENVR
jgi:hypothetical protein